jgi:hypothetical protein
MGSSKKWCAGSILEFEINLEKKRDIEDFVIGFMKDWEIRDSSRCLVEICATLSKDSRISQLVQDMFECLTEDNFERSFSEMTCILFDGARPDIANVVCLLAFSIVLDEKMKETEWYSPPLLYQALIDALWNAGFFIPHAPASKDIIKTVTNSLVILLPALLFYYVVSR